MYWEIPRATESTNQVHARTLCNLECSSIQPWSTSRGLAPGVVAQGCKCEVQGHLDARPSWKRVARLTWSKIFRLWRPFSSHDNMSALPARSQLSSSDLTQQGSKRHMQASPRADSTMPLKSDWQLRALHVETGSDSRRPSFEGANPLTWA